MSFQSRNGVIKLAACIRPRLTAVYPRLRAITGSGDKLNIFFAIVIV